MSAALPLGPRADESGGPRQPAAPGDAIFWRFLDLVKKSSGIVLTPDKRRMVEARLLRRYASLGVDGLDAYLRKLFRENLVETELPAIVDALSTNTTSFLREHQQFEALQNDWLDRLIAARPEPRPHLKIWSAACSTGPELYTLAMVAAEHQARRGAFTFTCLGTDISRDALATARDARYPLRQMRRIPKPWRSRYWEPWGQGEQPTHFSAKANLRRVTQLARLNLVERFEGVPRGFDLILLRNVLFYFDEPTQHAIVRKLGAHLRPGGLLIIGRSDPLLTADVGLTRMQPSFYVR